MNIQDYVPLKRVKNKRKTTIISAVIIIFIIFICMATIILIFINKKSKKEFLETSFYYVCAAKSKSIKELENMQDGVKEFGGAGKIYQKDEMFFLILNVYFDKESAVSVVEKNKSIYENAVILELKTKAVSNKFIRKFKQNEINIKFLKRFNADLSEIINLQMQYLSGEINENYLCSRLLTLKFNNDDLIGEIKTIEDEEFKNLVLNFASLKEMYFNSFFNNFFESDKKSSVLCDFVVSLSLLKVDFFNNL